MSTPPSAHRASSRRRRAPPRAFTGVATGAFRAEQRSLETAFSELDSNVIASVLERRNGNADLAAADLLEMKATSPGTVKTPGGCKYVGGSDGKRARTEGSGGDAAYWGSVLERGDAKDGDRDDDGEAMMVDGSSEDASSDGRNDGRTMSPGVIGWATYEWDDAMWAREPKESVRLSECEALVGWRRVETTVREERSEEGNEENAETTTNANPSQMSQTTSGVEMLVKWRGASHVHCSWVSVEAIETDIASGPHGKARVGRFFDKHPMEAGPFVSVKPDYVVVDRVFSKFEEQERTLVCVKWASLGYDETTWEEESYVRNSLEGGAVALERFETIRSGAAAARARQRVIEAETTDQVKEAWKSATADAVRERYGHSYRLRSYQEEGVKWMAFNFQAGRGCILADEMGLGKTAQALALIDYTLQVRPGAPALIVVPLSTIVNWEREAKRWVPDAHVVTYVGKQAGRDFAREHEWYHEKDPADEDAPRGIKANIVLTTYETVTADRAHFAKVKWSSMVIDEAHRLKRVGGKLGNDLNSLSVERTCLLTGTPLQNNTAELWSLLNFIDAKHFSNADDFEAAFGGMAKAAQVERLQNVLGPYLLRRLKCDVEQKLPPRSETLVECELAPLQKKCYRALFERNFSFLRQGCDSRENFANFANIMMEVRKCCQHPFLLDGVEAAVAPEGADPNFLVSSAGKLQLLDKLLPHLKEGDHRALIFSQMTRVLDVLEDYCRARGHTYVRLDGSITGKARQEAIDKYCNDDSDTFLFLLSTRAGGQGINLVQADTVIMFDSDWNPQNDAQALARAHRIGQTRQVQVYRLVMRATYEKEMFTRASMKLGLEQAIFGSTDKEEKSAAASRKEIEDLLKHGAYGLFKEDDGRAQEWNNESIVDILAKSERKLISGSENENASPDRPSTFATATFVEGDGATDGVSLDDPDFWQKLMPEAAAAEEERKAEAEQLMAKLQEAERIATAKRNAIDAFQWSWGEGKRLVASFALLGWGNWQRMLERSSLKENKTIAHIKIFCRVYIEEALKTLHAELYPNLIEMLTKGEDDDEKALPVDEGRDYLKYMMAEQGFSNFLRGRAGDDLIRLEMLQGGVVAVEKAGGMENALTEEGMQIPPLYLEAPAEWWTDDHDRALVVGTLKHGYGKYAEIRDDEELPFAANFAGVNPPEPVKKGSEPKVEDGDTDKPLEWIQHRRLADRVKRIFNVLGGKSYAPPPKIERPVKEKKPKPPKVPKEKKPKGTPRSGSGSTMEKLEKAQEFMKELKRDENGNIVLPVGPIGGVTIESLGVIKNNKDFVTAQYILPVGFRTSRMYPRLDNLDERTRWTQEIVEGPKGEPMFVLTPEEGCEKIEAKSATAAWADVLKRAKAAREARGEVAKKTAISGPEFFGYSLPNLRLMIESLPGADACKDYVPYAESCAKSEEIRKQRAEKASAEGLVAEEAPAKKDKSSDPVQLSQGYEEIDITAMDEEPDLLV